MDLQTTPLDSWHRRLGARMVPFAGYAMPVQYDFADDMAARCRGGVIPEHLHCRTKASLFDVSHMGQAMLEGAGAAEALERLVPGDIQGLKPGRQRYTLLLNDKGGIVGVFSRSKRVPLLAPEAVKTYEAWHFEIDPLTPAVAPPPQVQASAP